VVKGAKRTIVFDFDYTLVDSSRGVVDCIAFALRELGLPPAADDLARQTIGLSLPDTLIRLAGSQHARLGDEFARLFVQRADEVMVAKTAILDGVPETVGWLKAHGFALGIASTKYRRRIEVTLRREGLLQAFDAIVGGEDVSRHKPHPESLLLALSRLSSPRRGTLYVGDSVTDAETARRAGVPFVAVLSGVTPREAFEPYAGIEILGRLSDLPGRLGGIAVEGAQ
jgi:phosphoglycolate phosphatase